MQTHPRGHVKRMMEILEENQKSYEKKKRSEQEKKD
jgi:hypothetical protein